MQKLSINSNHKLIFPESRSLDIHCSDADEMHELSAYWSFEHHKQYSRGKFHGKILAINTPRLQLSLTSRAPGIFVRKGIPPGTSIVSIPFFNNRQPLYRGKLLERSHAIALKYGEELEYTHNEPSAVLTIACDSHLFNQKALEITGNSFDELRTQDYFLMRETCLNNRVNRLMSLLHSHLNRGDELFGPLGSNFEHEVFEIFFPGVLRQGEEPRANYSVLQAKKAEEFILDNLRKPLSISEVCQMTGTTKRTLHRGFKERYSVSPALFIKIMRLNAVRNELRQRRDRRHISQIATSWGFDHLSYFSRDYLRFFGERPSHTSR